jgi:hypothetical protein
VTYTKITSIAITADGSIEQTTTELPSIIKPPAVRVSIPKTTGHRLAARLLRRLADEIERQGEDAA